MDFKNILKTDYLDIIFFGKNKKYGGYELRKNYNSRMLLAGLIGIGVISALFASTLIEKKEDIEEVEFVEVDKTIAMTEPPPLKPNEPPPPAPTSPPPPARPTVKFTPPIIAKNEEVRKEEKMVELKKDEPVQSGVENKAGDNSELAVDEGLRDGPGGDGPVTKEEKAVEKPVVDNTPKRQIEKKAEFKGNFNSFLSNNLQYPPQASAENISGRVQVQFVVEVDGSVSDVKVLGKGLGGGCNQEAIRVIKKTSGMWTPGEEKGKKYRSFFVQTITFKLE